MVVNVRVVGFSGSCRKDSFSRSLESKSNSGGLLVVVCSRSCRKDS